MKTGLGLASVRFRSCTSLCTDAFSLSNKMCVSRTHSEVAVAKPTDSHGEIHSMLNVDDDFAQAAFTSPYEAIAI